MDEFTSHVRLKNYFKIQVQIGKLIEWYKAGVDDFCNLCFEPNCAHNTGRDNYEAAIGQLKYWQEIALGEARPIIVHPDHPVPSWGSLLRGGGVMPRLDMFLFYPAIPLSVVQVKRYQTTLLPEETHIGRISAKPGYYYYHRGTLVCRFTDGFFEPNLGVMDMGIPGEGNWYAIPKESDYMNFVKIGVWTIKT